MADFNDAQHNLNIQALRRQEEVEFERFYLAFAPALRLYLLRLSHNSELAQDLLQETFVKAYRALPHTTPELKLRPWLYQIATNSFRATFRGAAWRRFFPFPQSHLDWKNALHQGPAFEEVYAETELVGRAIAVLKPEYRAVLLLHWREGFRLEELCKILDLSKEGLKKRLYRAKKAFETAYLEECARVEGGS